MTEDRLHDLINGYIDGELTAADRDELKAELHENPASAEVLKRYIRAEAALRTLEQVALEDETEDDRLPQSLTLPTTGKTKRLTWIGVAAAMVIGTALTIWLLLIKPADKDNLFTSAYQIYPNVVSPSDDDSIETPVETVMRYYDAGDFATALAITNALLETSPTDSTLIFYRGIMHLELGMSVEAEGDFKIVAGSSGRFAEEAQWYLALTWLRMNRIEECKSLLTDIAVSESPFSIKAARLLERLSR